MLERSRLHPPRDFQPAVATSTASAAATPADRLFVSAEDFDGTGILAGIDPCASNYWWMPELFGSGAALEDGPTAAGLFADHDQATRRTASRTTAAA